MSMDWLLQNITSITLCVWGKIGEIFPVSLAPQMFL